MTRRGKRKTLRFLGKREQKKKKRSKTRYGVEATQGKELRPISRGTNPPLFSNKNI